MNTIKMRKGRWLMNAEPDEKGREKGACLWFEVSTKVSQQEPCHKFCVAFFAGSHNRHPEINRNFAQCSRKRHTPRLRTVLS